MEEEKKNIISIYKLLLNLILVLIISILLIPFIHLTDFSSESEVVEPSKVIVEETKPEIIDGIHVESGLKIDDGWEAVNMNCTRCHSATIITNNRFTRDGWKELIVWMQETQGLWQLGANEAIILGYLAKNYAPKEKKGRRSPLKIKEEDWYILE